MTNTISRRELLAGAASQRILGANERVRIAVCGIHKRGWDHVRLFAKLPNVEVAAVCDVDENVIRGRLSDMDKLGLPKPETFTDVRPVRTTCRKVNN